MSRDIPHSYSDDKICLGVEGYFQDYSVTAFCSPDSEGRTFIDGDQQIGDVTINDTYGAPFPVDVVIHDPIYPQKGEIEKIREEVGEDFANQFEGKVDSVFEKIKDADSASDIIEDIEDK